LSDFGVFHVSAEFPTILVVDFIFQFVELYYMN